MLTWPNWPLKLRTSSSHEEGAERDFAVMTTRFSGANGFVKKLHCVHVDDKLKTIPGSDFEIDAELVAAGDGVRTPGARRHDQGTQSGARSAWQYRASTDDYRTSIDKVFAAGDMRRGQSLVVWAIREGRQAARAVDAYLMGSSLLPQLAARPLTARCRRLMPWQARFRRSRPRASLVLGLRRFFCVILGGGILGRGLFRCAFADRRLR